MTRQKRFYYEIHLGGAVVDGIGWFSGMLEAERVVDEKAQNLREKMQRPLRGFLIMRLGRRERYRAVQR